MARGSMAKIAAESDGEGKIQGFPFYNQNRRRCGSDSAEAL
jgi:hypothetical protein